MAVAGPAPAAIAGSISGTVTDSVTDDPIQGIEVCATPSPYTFEVECVETNAGGSYLLGGLPAASYHVRFSASSNNLNYVNEYYDDKESFPGDLVTVGASEAKTGIDAELDEGGVVTGTVTDAVSLDPVANFPVCAFAPTGSGEVGHCARTDSNGDYAVKGLPTEEYQVEFLGEGEFNYITQYWEGSETHTVWDPVPVTVEQTTSGIDAALNRGVEISGTLREVGTGQPVGGVAVSLLDPGSEELLKWVNTDSSGHYAFRGRPADTYVVAFSRPRWGFDGDGFSTQYYKGASSFGGATQLTVAPPEVFTGIDGEVVNEFPPQKPETIQVTILPPPPPPKKPFPCRRGFRKKKVKGKVRCVRVHKRKHRRNVRGRPRSGRSR